MKLILIPCASGVATSTIASEKLKALCTTRGLDVDVRPVSFKSLGSLAPTADLIVTIAPYDTAQYGVPVLSGVPLLTGVGADVLMNEVEAALRQPAPGA